MMARRVLSVSTAVVAAAVFEAIFIKSHSYWLPLTAYLVTFPLIMTPVTQVIRYFLVILVTYILGLALINFVPHVSVLYFFFMLVLISLGSILTMPPPLSIQRFYLLLLPPIILLILIFSPAATLGLQYHKLVELILGASIGAVSAFLMLPMQSYQPFQSGVLPLLQANLAYTQAMTYYFLHNQSKELVQSKRLVENAMQSEPGRYPEWVFDPGFNPGLRSGFRYFLIKLDSVADILFAMHSLINQGLHPNSVEKIKIPLRLSLEKNEMLMQIIIHYFQTNQLDNGQSDFTSDMRDLENKLRQVVPQNLELLDISTDYIQMISLVRDIKDMRELLLQLVSALPSNHHLGAK